MDTAVFFDVDGTLVCTAASVQTIYERTCEKLNIDADVAACQYYFDQFFKHLGTDDEDAYRVAGQDLVTAYSIPVDVDSFVNEYPKQEIAATSVDPVVYETVEQLSRDCSLGVITNGVTAVQQEKLAFHGLADYIETVITASDDGAPKPDPELFEVAVQTTDTDRLVYVGDSMEKDALPAQEAGFNTILVGAHNSDAADLVISDHSEFSKIRDFISL